MIQRIHRQLHGAAVTDKITLNYDRMVISIGQEVSQDARRTGHAPVKLRPRRRNPNNVKRTRIRGDTAVLEFLAGVWKVV